MAREQAALRAAKARRTTCTTLEEFSPFPRRPGKPASRDRIREPAGAQVTEHMNKTNGLNMKAGAELFGKVRLHLHQPARMRWGWS